MTDPMTPLTAESEKLLAEVHGTSMALTVFPSRLRAIEAAAARRALEGSGVVEALRFLSTYEKDPPEVMYDQWAYIRLLAFVHDVATCALDGVPTAPGWSSRPYAGAIRQALAALPRPEEPRVERCLTSCGCDGRRLASECSGPYPPDSPVNGCRRCNTPEARR